MGLQTIIDNCNKLNINRRKLVGVQYTRNEIPRVSLTPTLNPWRFTLDLPTNMRYSQVRSLLEEIDTLDRIHPEIISFGDNPQLNWLFRYQGVLSQSLINNLRVQSFDGNQLVLTGLPPMSASALLFAKNDLIQIGDNPYPFTSTTDVLRGTSSTVTITTHRPNILSADVTGSPVTVGTDCQFNMFCPNMPTYRLFPGGSIADYTGQVISNALIEWSDSFQLYEYVGGA